MSILEMSLEGIRVEKLSLNWVQIVGASFSLGIAYAAIFYVHGLSVENRTIIDSRTSYITRFEQLDKETTDNNKLYQELNRNVITLNSNLETIHLLRQRDDKTNDNLQNSLKDLEKNVNDLTMKVIKLESETSKTSN